MILGGIAFAVVVVVAVAAWIVRRQRRLTLTDLHLPQLSRTLIETANDLVYVLTPDRRILFLNPVFESHTQWKVNEWLGRCMDDLIHPDDLPAALERYPTYLTGGHLEPHIMRLRTAGGEDWWGEFKSRPIMNGRRVVGVVGIATDVTARLRMEKHLRESEKFLQEIFSNIQDGISILDKDMNVMRANATLERWNADRLPLTGKKCYEVFHDRSEPCENCPSRKTLATGQASHAVVSVPGGPNRLPGSMEIHTFPLLDSDTNELKGVIEFVRNVTKRLQAEQALQDSQRAKLEAEDKFRRLVEHTLVGICIIRRNRFLYVNPEMARLFGYTREEMLALSDVLALLADEELNRGERHLWERFEGKGPVRTRWRGKRKDGKVLELETSGSLIEYEGAPALLTSAMDVTSSARSEAGR